MSEKKRSNRARRRQRSRRGSAKPRRKEQRQLLTGSLLTGEVFATAFTEEDSGAVDTYLAAHRLLPEATCLDDEAEIHGRISRALGRLADQKAAPEDLLEAIVILGHVPSSIALTALQRHAASDRPHADVARIAADECLSWMADLDQLLRALGPEPAAPPVLN